MSEAEKWAKPTLAEEAEGWVVEELKTGGPMPTGELSRAAKLKGVGSNALGIAKRNLKKQGKITIKRYGSRTSPFIVELVEG